MNPEQPRCVRPGCKALAFPTKKAPVPICKKCRADRRLRDQAMHAWRDLRWAKNIEEEAQRETASLPREDSYIPLTGEALVLKMLRGEW